MQETVVFGNVNLFLVYGWLFMCNKVSIYYCGSRDDVKLDTLKILLHQFAN